jgi:hypothetical protein
MNRDSVPLDPVTLCSRQYGARQFPDAETARKFLAAWQPGPLCILIET